MRCFKWLLATLALVASMSWAAAPAVVEVVQAPAWLERNGATFPLTPGAELMHGDRVRTGAGARAYLMLAEGSRVKLGESAQFTLHSRSLAPEKFFRGALEIAAGAFRFTTGLIAKKRERELAIRVGTATIGIRGTDIWGKSDRDGDLVALVEGHIEITRGGETTDMAQPMSYYDAPAKQVASVKPLDAEVFKGLARQTEIEVGDGAARRMGPWTVLVAGEQAKPEALALYDRVRAAGFAAHIRPQADKATAGNWLYQVRVPGYASAAEAAVAAARLKTAVGGEPRPVR